MRTVVLPRRCKPRTHRGVKARRPRNLLRISDFRPFPGDGGNESRSDTSVVPVPEGIRLVADGEGGVGCPQAPAQATPLP